MNLSRALRITLVTATVSAAATVLTPVTANAATLNASLVATRSTSVWPRNSPDPSGITYNSAARRLIISDGEVDEMPQYYKGTNLFVSTLAGAQSSTFPGGTTLPWSNEPAGVSYRSSDRHLFVSDDDQDRVFQVRPGTDARYGTADDTITSFPTRPIGSGDPEDVAVDMDVTNAGELLIVDGVNREVYLYGPGPNGVLDGVDDTFTQYDVERYGAMDPEGIAYHPTRNTVLVLDSRSKKVYELRLSGTSATLLNIVNLTAARPVKPAGIVVAPASNGSGAQRLYIVDRGVDNNVDPNENDGRFYEMAVTFPPL